jgi:transposase-like protein
MNLTDLAQNFTDEKKARAFLEKQLWPDGPVCPHCGLVNEAYKLEARKDSKRPVREGVWKCRGCAKQFSVTIGTIFEDSHIPLHKWLMAIHLMNASKKGISAHQMHRMLGLGYRAAWFMCHRIRHAMDEPLNGKLEGTVEVDETYVGGKEPGVMGKPNVYRSKKTPVVALVERNGRVKSMPVERVTANNLKPILAEYLAPQTILMTDESNVYPTIGKKFAAHHVIRHGLKIYARKEGETNIHTNTVEGFFSLLKRGVYGTFHHVSRQHLYRYLNEFDFRYNSRNNTDGERASLALLGARGKRLMYRTRLGLQN